jgi:TolB protein
MGRDVGRHRTLPVVGTAATLLWLSTVAGGQAPAPPYYPSSKQGGNHMFSYYLPPAPSSTPWAPAWSPDGKWIAIGMSGSLWKVDPATGVAFELTYSDRKYHSSPDWSPDGKWIIYTADDGGQTIQLEILNVETGATAALTSDAGVYNEPVFSPDGSKVAYVSTRPRGYFNVYIRPIRDGKWAGEEVAVTKDNRYGTNREFPAGEYDLHISPAWMRDGRELLLVSNRNVTLGSGNVLRVPAELHGIDRAQTVLAEQTYYRTQPHVSIDGKRFVYSSTRGSADQFVNLYVQPTSGGEPYKLTFFEHDAFHPRWSPDGEWIAYISNREGLPQLALLETYGGERRDVRVIDRRWKRPMGALAVRVVEAETGQPTEARIHLTAADGKFYAPDDAYAMISRGGDNLFQSTGRFTVALPAGRAELLTVKGFEFWPEKTTAEIKAHEVTSVTVPLRRMTDMSARGWYNGSTHVHMNWGGNLHQTPQMLMMMSKAEDQDVLTLQVVNQNNRILDHQYFVPGGGPHPLSAPDHLLIVGQEYRPPFYGHVFMFGMKSHLISPFLTGYAGTAVESLYPSNTDMFRKAKAQGATVGYVHAFGGEADPLETTLGHGKGFIVDAALGTTDVLEWSTSARAGFFPLYAVWNNGLKVAAVGGEDSVTSEHHNQLVGAARTYVFTGSRGLDMDAWLGGLRAGRSFVSTGPLVELAIDGMMPGEELALPSAGGQVAIEARVRSITALTKVSLICNGETIQEIPLNADKRGVDFRMSLRVTRSGWYHLRAEGVPADRFPLDTTYAQGFTNPIWITVGGQPIRNRGAAEYAIKWIDKLQQMAGEHRDWRSQRERDHVFRQFEEARQVYRRMLGEAAGTEQGR